MDIFLQKNATDFSADEKFINEQLADHLSNLKKTKFEEITKVNLRLSYVANFLSRILADKLLNHCEKTLTYFEGDLAKVRVFNKWHAIPRKQVAYGDEGLEYKFSGTMVTAKKWPPFLLQLKRCVSEAAECDFNFVLVNRYADGNDYIGEHRDDEKDLDPTAPIASLSIGQPREFVLRHERRRKGDVDAPENVKINLANGSLLLMRPPTNRHWYHSIPKRKRSIGVRLNFTFRKLIV